MKLSILKVSLVFMIFSSLNTSAKAEEYFGEFSGEPSFKVKTNIDKRPTFLLLEDFYFKDPNGFDWFTPKDWEVDGASIPKFAWSLVGGPMSGKYIHASIIHDRYCDIKSRTAHDTHRNFYYGMKANGVSNSKANIMYWAVRTFGPSWKVVKTTLSSGVIGPNKYGLSVKKVNAPVVPDEKINELIDKINSDLSIDELDKLSDNIRKEYGSEQLQKTIPTLRPNEMLNFDPSKVFRNIF